MGIRAPGPNATAVSRYGTVLNRGCTTESGFGDGTYPVSVVLDGGQAVYVQVDFR
jgi:hypothetical protein